MKVKLYVQAVKWSFEGGFQVITSTHKGSTTKDRVVIDICERIVDIDAPEIDEAFLINGEVEQIEAAIKKEQADSLARVIAMQERKASLLSIENMAGK